MAASPAAQERVFRWSGQPHANRFQVPSRLVDG